MEEIFKKACEDRNIHYVQNMMSMYIDVINYTTNNENESNNIVYTKNEIDINSIIDRTNKNKDNTKLQIKKNAFENAIHDGDINIVKCLFENKKQYGEVNILDNQSILYWSCIKGYIDIIKYIVDYNWTTTDKLDISFDDDYIFLVACIYSNIDIMIYLIKYGEKINKKINLSYRDYYRIIIPTKNMIYTEYDTYTKLKYILYLTKHNYGKCTSNKISCDVLFNCKYIDTNSIVYSTQNVVIYNNIQIYCGDNKLIPVEYINYCLFIKINEFM